MKREFHYWEPRGARLAAPMRVNSYLPGMIIADKIVTLLCLLGGFLWLRERVRAVNPDDQMGRAVIGVFVILPAVLFGEKYLFEHYHFGLMADLLIKAVLLLLPFPLIGFLLLKRKQPPKDGAESAATGQPPQSEGEGADR